MFSQVLLFLVLLPLKGRANLKWERSNLWGGDFPGTGALACWDDRLLITYPNPKCVPGEPEQALVCNSVISCRWSCASSVIIFYSVKKINHKTFIFILKSHYILYVHIQHCKKKGKVCFLPLG